jgi:chromosome segregation ATPase
MDTESAINFLVEHATTADVRLASIDSRVANVDSRLASVDSHLANVDSRLEHGDSRLANMDTRIEFLVEHVAKTDTELAGINERLDGLAARKDVAALEERIREGTKAMRQYTAYVETMLNAVTKGQLSLEEQVVTMRAHVESIEQRLADLEKRNPPQAA